MIKVSSQLANTVSHQGTLGSSIWKMFVLIGRRSGSAFKHVCASVWVMHILLAVFVVLPLMGIANSASAQSVASRAPFRDCPDCPEMVVVPQGNFLMGLSDDEVKRDETQESLLHKIMNLRGRTGTTTPLHSVRISQPFALGRNVITRNEFTVFARETGLHVDQPCEIKGGSIGVKGGSYLVFSSNANWENPGFDQSDRDPVVCVSWVEARAYVAWLNGKLPHAAGAPQDGPYYLPSEAEWEYAARAGTRTTRWWGDAIGKNKAICLQCGSPWDGQQPAPVGIYGANGFGLNDMLGNVWQWTADCWNENYTGAPADGGAWLSGNCTLRVLRGGSWRTDAEAVTVTARMPYTAEYHSQVASFRVAKAIPALR